MVEIIYGKDAQKKLNLTSIMIHHDMNLALEYANRVAVIKEGEKILEIGILLKLIFQKLNLAKLKHGENI